MQPPAQPAGRRRLPSTTSQSPSTALLLLPTTTLDKEVTANSGNRIPGKGWLLPKLLLMPLSDCPRGLCCWPASQLWRQLLPAPVCNPSQAPDPLLHHCVAVCAPIKKPGGTKDGKIMAAWRLGCSHPAYSLLPAHSCKREKR